MFAVPVHMWPYTQSFHSSSTVWEF